MAARLVQLRERAAADIDRAADYYLSEAGTDIALRFVDAVERSINRIGRSPGSGSLRFAYELEIPDLRARAVDRFPFLAFYVVSDEAVDVWRILHTSRDIPAAIVDDVDD